MIVGKHMVLIPLLFLLLRAGDDQLLRIGEKHSCIRQVIAAFVDSRNCNVLHDSAKSLALKMTECLLLQMGKALPAGCGGAVEECRLEGDAWNTFSTFFTHIDNLCHFYWETMHHERAELLIGQLSQSSQNAESLLRRNAHETSRILQTQRTMQHSLQDSLAHQREMATLINSSARHISNLTLEMESFVRRIHQDISENYGSVRTVLDAMNQGLSQALAVQSYMTAELTTIRGCLYYLSNFLLLLFLTSFSNYAHARPRALLLLALTLLLELTSHTPIDHLIGIDRLRYLTILLQLLSLWKTNNKQNELQDMLQHHFNTPRLKSVFKKAILQNQSRLYPIRQISSHQFYGERQVGKVNLESKWVLQCQK